MMCDQEPVQFYVQIDQDLYEEIEKLLASHTNYNNSEAKQLRAIIRMVARKLKMDIPLT